MTACSAPSSASANASLALRPRRARRVTIESEPMPPIWRGANVTLAPSPTTSSPAAPEHDRARAEASHLAVRERQPRAVADAQLADPAQEAGPRASAEPLNHS